MRLDVFVFDDDEGVLLVVLDAVVVVDALVLEGGWLRDARNQSLYRASHRIIIHGKLILYQRTRIRIGRWLLRVLRIFFTLFVLLTMLAAFFCLLLGVDIRIIFRSALGLVLLLLFVLLCGLPCVILWILHVHLIKRGVEKYFLTLGWTLSFLGRRCLILRNVYVALTALRLLSLRIVGRVVVDESLLFIFALVCILLNL